MNITPKKIHRTVIIISLILIIGYLTYQFSFLIKSPKLLLNYPAENIQIGRSMIDILGQTNTNAKLTINGQPVYINKDGNFQQEINLSQGLNILKIEAINRFGKKSEITRQIIVNN